jgi:hypothetical protein
MLKKIITRNNKSHTFIRITNFNFQHDINFKISLQPAVCFLFNNEFYKIENSIYSITNAIHSSAPLQEEPILNLEPTFIEDTTEYKINNEYLKITKTVIKERLQKINRDWSSVLSKQYLSSSFDKIKLISKKLLIKENMGVDGQDNTQEINKLKNALRVASRQFSSDWAEYETVALISYLENEIKDISIYFIFFLDFRGRMYTISTYGPISNKIIRNILIYNKKYNIDDYQRYNEGSETSALIKKKYYPLLSGIKLNDESDYIKNSLFWVLISLASPYKNKLLLGDTKISLEELLNKGRDIFLNKDQNMGSLDLDEEIEIRRNIFIADQLVSGVFDQNTFLCKDSTASVFQHLFFYLKPKNLEALQICNIVGSDY